MQRHPNAADLQALLAKLSDAGVAARWPYRRYNSVGRDLDNFRSHATFHHISALQGLKVRSFSQTATIPAGSWTVVVQNSENIFNTMVVHLRVVSNPG
jgi:hypothetical protein